MGFDEKVAENITGALRPMGEITADIRRCLSCLESRHICTKQCALCAYLPYEDNFSRLAREKYAAFMENNVRETAITGIPTCRLVEICRAEREKLSEA